MQTNLQNLLTIFFPARNRKEYLKKTLENISNYCPESFTIIANCSSQDKIDEMSALINSFKNTQEVIMLPDPGLSIAYNKLFMEKINTPYCLWLADDVLFTKNVDLLIERFEKDPNIHLIGLPMIDNMDDLKGGDFGPPWGCDQHGCAMWLGPDGTTRFAHHAIIRTSFFRNIGNIANETYPADYFCNNRVDSNQRYWPTDGAYVYHKRLLDDTRVNSIWSAGNFLNPISIRNKYGNLSDAKKRD